MAKSSLERSFEKYQKEMERQFKKKLASDKKIADKQRRDSERQLKMNARRERATSIVMGQPTVGDIRILDSSAEELVSLICQGYCRRNFLFYSNITNKNLFSLKFKSYFSNIDIVLLNENLKELKRKKRNEKARLRRREQK